MYISYIVTKSGVAESEYIDDSPLASRGGLRVATNVIYPDLMSNLGLNIFNCVLSFRVFEYEQWYCGV